MGSLILLYCLVLCQLLFGPCMSRFGWLCLVVVRRSTSGVDCPGWTVSALGPIQTDTQPSEIALSVV